MIYLFVLGDSLTSLRFTTRTEQLTKCWEHPVAGRICNNFLVNRALFDKSMKLGTCVDL